MLVEEITSQAVPPDAQVPEPPLWNYIWEYGLVGAIILGVPTPFILISSLRLQVTPIVLLAQTMLSAGLGFAIGALLASVKLWAQQRGDQHDP